MQPPLKTGAACRTKRQLQPAEGLRVSPMHIENRRGGQAGRLLGPAEGHDGAVWFVQHRRENRVAAYWVEELVHLAPRVKPQQWALFE